MLDDKLFIFIIIISPIILCVILVIYWILDAKYIFLKTHPTILKLAEEIKKGNIKEIEDEKLLLINFEDYKISYFFTTGGIQLFKNEIKISINAKECDVLYKSIKYLFRLQQLQSRSLLND